MSWVQVSKACQYRILLFAFTYFEGNCIADVSFRSKDEEIELVPETEFFRDAPKEISKPVSNLDNDCTEKIKHVFMVC